MRQKVNQIRQAGQFNRPNLNNHAVNKIIIMMIWIPRRKTVNRGVNKIRTFVSTEAFHLEQ